MGRFLGVVNALCKRYPGYRSCLWTGRLGLSLQPIDMRIDLVTLFPDMLGLIRDYGVTQRACEQGHVTLMAWNPRDVTSDRHRTVDDRPYGGGPGMVMKVQPLRDTLRRIRTVSGSQGRVIYLTPQGRRFTQQAAQQLAQQPHLILIAGRYEGVDERFIQSDVDEEWSIGDYVLSGGELAAFVMMDVIIRLLPNVLGDEQSALQDSFMTGLLDHPQYTRPERIDDQAVPAILLSGDHGAIARWRLQQALLRTALRRPDLLAQYPLTAEQQRLLNDR